MRKNTAIITIVFFSVFMLLQAGFAEVSEQEAAKLKSTLTPLGAEKAGNKEGTIPAWEGGYTTVPPGYKSGDVRPDPFEKEKPLYSITAKNMDQYAEKLAEGAKDLLKKHSTFRIDVYPAHRTAAAPQCVYDGTFKNATRAKTTENGLSFEGAYNGIPFPIPKNGNEAMWNHVLAWRGVALFIPFRNYLVTTGGKAVLTAEAEDNEQYPNYQCDVPIEQWNKKTWYFRQIQTAPAFKSGETILAQDDWTQGGRQNWQYLTGQRRVRRAPSISYDTPDFVNSGHNYFDEVFVFNGMLDRYDWKIVGKQEMIIPYNCNSFFHKKDNEVMGEKHLNSDYLRWELHRVWVVEATLASGKRHAVPKRRFYLDEDTWKAVMCDGWDGQNQLWRFIMTVPLLAMEVPAVSTFTQAVYNLQTGAYGVNILFNEMPKQMEAVPPRPDSFFTPDALAGSGVR
ncbi:MAG: DUF1329 domain-containing protein [Pseudomonadota bacterium]